MKTRLVKIQGSKEDKELIQEAAQIISQGGLVSFPTETVYGLGANGLDPVAIEKIFRAKGRPQDNPLILHVASRSQLDSLVLEVNEQMERAIEAFWPGPLTLLFKRSQLVPDEITAGLDTVAIRMPDNPVALDLIRAADLPIAAPSANTSGRPSPTAAQHVYQDLEGSVDLILDGGRAGIGLESTVLDLTGLVPTILRPGGVTLEDLSELLGPVEVDGSIINFKEKIIPKSPGQKYRHYAPKSDMYIFQGALDLVRQEITSRAKIELDQGRKVGIMSTQETQQFYRENLGQALVYSMGSRVDEASIAHNLFHILREMDQENVDIILAETVDFSDLGLAIMNRLIKAAGGRLVEV